jgi:hypothetical protein
MGNVPLLENLHVFETKENFPNFLPPTSSGFETEPILSGRNKYEPKERGIQPVFVYNCHNEK